jgi:basic membrane lipoprotein Med (substrate-binding protein (PBP1-ABC) superfamily)
MRLLALTITAALLAAISAGCPAGNGGGGKAGGASTPASAPVKSLGTVALVRSDLGIGDGIFVRELDAALSRMAAEGRIEYAPVGELPVELNLSMGKDDIGLPEAGSADPGTMTLAEATALVQQAGQCDLLVLSSQLLVQPALNAVAAGQIAPAAILVTDDYLIGGGWAGSSVPVYTISYDVSDVAFMCGVAVAKSSVNGMFTMLASADDPQADAFLKAAKAGAKYQTNGAGVATMVVPETGGTDVLDPETFQQALQRIKDDYGDYFTPNHYIINLGRATPTIMQALASDAYLVGAYADFTRVRPPRVLGCMEKHPGVALELLLGGLSSLGELPGQFNNGSLQYGLKDGAVGFTDFSLYGRYNPDADDIKEAVEKVRAQILAGEMDIDYRLDPVEEAEPVDGVESGGENPDGADGDGS